MFDSLGTVLSSIRPVLNRTIPQSIIKNISIIFSATTIAILPSIFTILILLKLNIIVRSTEQSVSVKAVDF